eukprot:6959020-Prymnesium_polylepis.1
MTADAPPASHVERSDALGAVELVRRDGEQVDLQRIDVDGHLADGLRRVHVEEDLRRGSGSGSTQRHQWCGARPAPASRRLLVAPSPHPSRSRPAPPAPHTFFLRQSLPISAMGWITPISLFVCITETSDVSGRIAASSACGRAREPEGGGQRRARAPGPLCRRTADDTKAAASRVSGRARLEVDEAVCAHRQVGHVEALLLQPAARVEHALVLSDGRDDVVLLWMVELRHALDRHVVRLGGARGEDDLLRVGADERRHLLARRVDHLRRLPP